jgi:hypothetical protein
MGFRSELADVLRLYRSGFAFFRLAQVEAEALVWHHGSEGVAIARAREALNAGEPRVQRLHDWLVRLLAERSHDLFRRGGCRHGLRGRGGLGAAAGADDHSLNCAWRTRHRQIDAWRSCRPGPLVRRSCLGICNLKDCRERAGA